MKISDRTLDVQRNEFKKRRFLATPISGAIVWLLIGISDQFIPEKWMSLVLFVGTGSIVYLALFISKYTGENFLKKGKPKNEFDNLFMHTVIQALLVYAIAIPFYLIDPNSLPLTVGILTGLMWIPFSWIIQHWIGLFHAGTRTVLILICWYLFPESAYTYIPSSIVIIYILTIYILNKRYRLLTSSS
jgi:hypothetical protein